MTIIDRAHLAELLIRERQTYRTNNPKSLSLYEQADNLFGSVPMTWMNKWSGGFPLYLERAHGNRVTDVDGHTYIDFALGDTGAMAGHSPQASISAITERIINAGGITTMLPTADAQWVGAELTKRFGLPLWSFTLTATDANRWAIRLARLATGKSKILVFSYCYHGSVDETFAVPDETGKAVSRPGNVAPPIPLHHTTRVVEFNDLAAVERELAHGDVAAILTEPALTNIGIVLPRPGFLPGLRELATKYQALLMIDETHTFSAGPGGMTARDNLQPDIFIIGKSIGAGIPSGAYGITNEVAQAIAAHAEADLIDVGGVGGTLAGNALSLAAMRATLGEVLTDAAFAHMIELGTRYTNQVQEILTKYEVDWSIAQIGARAEYRFVSPAPTSGTDSANASDDALDEFMHLYMCNRGVLMTPFHNMALMCPATTVEDVDKHQQLFESAIQELTQIS
ncbi:MAG: aminotransferase class III-fold pyridoxal phosphate-dependent enzyme [Actinobacteria bacterium]|nr:aminotransferase class III-fold pyridoxal phosphate-dependent enzyme [Actinomycetota bacterium]NBY15343.1 aminotransferase class III-fold pyridoxal phosphate-dependent enzyme [Actinomycetota bacterium]